MPAEAPTVTELQPVVFNQPSVEGAELDYVKESVESGHMASSGPFCRRAGAVLQEETGAEEVLLTTSCTAALELSAMLLDFKPGDTVIVPSFTFTTTALAFVRQGARVVFCDIEPRTLGLDTDHLATLLDGTVRAVIPVHYAGIACDVGGLRAALSDWPDVAVIEDNAHGLYGRWNGEPLGSIGRFASLSFHETKNFVCGEGGALLVNRPEDVDRARVLYDKGTNRRAFLLGQVDKYSWKDTGSSFGLSDTLAAFLCGQLEKRDVIQAKRRAVFERYLSLLSPSSKDLGFRLPVIPDYAEPSWHLFYVLLPDRPTRDAVLSGMRTYGVNPAFHYVPLHSSDAGIQFAARPSDCPVSEDVAGRLVRLPFHNNVSEGDAERVVGAFLSALAEGRRQRPPPPA
ncbi:MAG TPA: dTDP-4-amino-4,6-dideoxygalactose transaminase [Pseudonocardiaceae bacterium]|nr:dTDP-4-amino-4,6-dideoxygalactose transaminase [Pseudonocardiaceae bacterium]